MLLLILFFFNDSSQSENSKSKWVNLPSRAGDTTYFNIKDADEIGPGQFKIQSMVVKSEEKKKYLKKVIAGLVRYCGKKDGQYVPHLTDNNLFIKDKSPDLQVSKIRVITQKGSNKAFVGWDPPYSRFKGYAFANLVVIQKIQQICFF